MTETQTAGELAELQSKINAFWSWRGSAVASGALAIRDEAELAIWMSILRAWLPPAPADVVDLGTGQGFLALVLAAFGHRVRGYDLAEGQLDRAREFGAQAGFQQAGFQEVDVTRLEQLEDFERRQYGADKTWLVLTAIKPMR